MFNRLVCLTAMLFTSFYGSANATVISTYTDQTAWETALSSSLIFEETFSGGASNFTANSINNSVGIISVDLLGGTGDAGPTGLTDDGYFQSEVDSDGTDALGITFNHLAGIGLGLLGLQNDSGTTPGGLNLVEIGLLIDGSSFLVTDLLGLTDSATATGNIRNQVSSAAIPFLGFVLDAPVDSFSIVHADLIYAGGVSGNSEEFYLAGLLMAQASVPEPAMLILLLSGLTGLVMVRKRGIRRIKPA